MARGKTRLLNASKPSDGFQDYLADTLSPLGRIESKRVFGLHGIKAGGVLLGLVIDEQLYLRTDESTRASYVAEGSRPFTFAKQTGELIETSYYPLPDSVYDDHDTLLEWARRAQEAARESPSARKRREARARRLVRTPQPPKIRPDPPRRRKTTG